MHRPTANEIKLCNVYQWKLVAAMGAPYRNKIHPNPVFSRISAAEWFVFSILCILSICRRTPFHNKTERAYELLLPHMQPAQWPH